MVPALRLPAATLALAALATLAAFTAAPLPAQQPERTDPRTQEPRERVPQDEVPDQDTAAAAVPAPYPPARFSLALSLGGLGNRPLQSQTVLAERRDAAGTVLGSAILGRSMDAEGGFEVGIAGTLSLGPTWAVRVGAGLGRTTFGVAYNGDDDLFVTAAGHLAGREAVYVTLVTLDAALRMRIPSTRRAQPYLELGAASMTWRGSSPLAGAPALDDGVHRIAGTAAAGVVVPVRNRMAAQLRVSSRTYRTPVGTTPAGDPGVSSSTLAITFAAPETRPFADPALELTTALRLDLGLSLALGGPIPTDPPGP